MFKKYLNLSSGVKSYVKFAQVDAIFWGPVESSSIAGNVDNVIAIVI
jgi:hypothetical protein